MNENNYSEIKKNYQQRLEFQTLRYDKNKKTSLYLSLLRLFLFSLALTLGIYAYNNNPDYLIWIIIIFAFLFVWIVKIHSKMIHKKLYLEKYIELIQNELLALDGQTEQFFCGENYIDYEKNHLHFTIDFDVFGKDSLFQFLNRTVTLGGEKMLAHWLKFPEKEKEKIIQKQEAVQELSENLDFRHGFGATGKTQVEEPDEYRQLVAWLANEDVFLQKKVFQFLTYLVPFINLSFIALAIFGILPWSFFALSFTLSLSIVGSYFKKINQLHQMVSRKVDILEKYQFLLKKIERENFYSSLLIDLKNKLHQDGLTSIQSIKNLSKILADLDKRLNIIAGIILNGIFLWDILQIIRIEKWKQKNGKHLVVWFDVIAKFDALMSLANYRFNYPENIFPEVSENYFELKCVELRHPLMRYSECVPNDVSINHSGNFMIITGANMAGKSTFLRTIGVNLLLAMLGAPVSAKKFKFFPTALLSSIRINDSLKKGTSYFYAEIKQLEYIISELKSGEKVFVFLDEILRGTNSKDKEQGSKALLRQLLTLNASGIIATHDLNLANLTDEFEGQIQAKCFEVEVIDNELFFDYTLKEGSSKTMSATILMNKMGITI